MPAPPRWPARSDSATAASSTTPPRATFSTIDPGLSFAIAALPISPRVARVSGTWTVTTSARRRSSSISTSSTPWLAACSAVTYGSTPMTVISMARARRAMAWPILPRPTMPSVRPRSSRPVNCERFHSPRRIDASAAAVRRATPYISARVCSAAAMVLPVGALTTVMPARVAASRSTLSTPTPARPMTTSLVPAAISAASTWTWLRTMSASYSGMTAHSSSRLSPMRSSTSWWPRRSSMPSAARGSATRTFTRRPPRGRRRRRPRGRRPGRPRRPSPGPTDRPIPSDTNSSVLMAPRISSIVTDPRWPRRKILPVSLP